MNEDHIKEIFGTFGTVKSVELAIRSKWSISPEALLMWSLRSGADAEKARMAMDGGQLDGNYLRQGLNLRDRFMYLAS